MSVYGQAALSVSADKRTGLWVNIERVRAENAIVLANALALALGKPVHKSFWDALGMSHQERTKMQLDSLMAQKEQEIMGRLGGEWEEGL